MIKLIGAEEREYQQLRSLAQKLHIPIPEAFWELEVRDKDGRIIQRHRQRSHSWVRNAYNLLLSEMASKDANDSTFGAGLLSIKDTGGITRYGSDGACVCRGLGYGFEASSYAYRCPAGDNSHGIQVGSGTNAESFEDYVLQTLIANGSGAGQLAYALSELPTKSYNAGTKVFTITWVRYMNNNSGGSVSVNEVGLTTYGSVSGQYKFLMSRDKLASTVTIPNTGQLKVTYTIQLTYPA